MDTPASPTGATSSASEYNTTTEDEFMTGEEDSFASSDEGANLRGRVLGSPTFGAHSGGEDDDDARLLNALDSVGTGTPPRARAVATDATFSRSGTVEGVLEPVTPGGAQGGEGGEGAESDSEVQSPETPQAAPGRKRSSNWSRVASLAHLMAASRHFTSTIAKLRVRAIARSHLKKSDENIHVCIRVRPFNDRERKLKSEGCLQTTDTGVCVVQENQVDTLQFGYDRVFAEASTQAEVYEGVMTQPVSKYLAGFNVCVFCYGQTGAGKTWTMLGDDNATETLGLVPRAMRQVFDFIAGEESVDYSVNISVVEIYNEGLRDLLSDAGSFRLDIREDKTRGVYVRNLTEQEVESPEAAAALLDQAAAARVTGETSMNARSSRSHMVFSVRLEQVDAGDGVGYARKTSVMHLVDLAGSERAKSTGAKGQRLKEGAAINLSLSNLGFVINALVKQARGDGQAHHIPFRNSKLTRLLQNALGGNSSTVMMANVSPARVNNSETVSTLRFATRAKQVQNRAKVNYDPQAQIALELKEENARLREKVERLELALEVEQTRAMLQTLDSSAGLSEEVLNAKLASLNDQQEKAEAAAAAAVPPAADPAAEAVFERRAAELTDELAQANAELAQSNAECGALRRQVEEGSAALTKERGRIQELLGEIDVFQEERHEQQELEAMQAESVAQLRQEAAAQSAETEALRRQVDDQADMLGQLQGELQALEESKAGLAQELRAARAPPARRKLPTPPPFPEQPANGGPMSDFQVIQHGMQLASGATNTAEPTVDSSRADLLRTIAAMKEEAKATRQYVDKMLAIIIERCPEVLELK